MTGGVWARKRSVSGSPPLQSSFSAGGPREEASDEQVGGKEYRADRNYGNYAITVTVHSLTGVGASV
jgi:hypothetical protein